MINSTNNRLKRLEQQIKQLRKEVRAQSSDGPIDEYTPSERRRARIMGVDLPYGRRPRRPGLPW